MSNLTEALPYLAGPGSAVVVLLVVLGGLYNLTIKHLIPLMRAFGDRHLQQIDTLLAQNKEESIAITRALQTIDSRLAVLESRSYPGHRD